ncbi:MAG: radical SAM protein [Thermoproteota archaeon]
MGWWTVSKRCKLCGALGVEISETLQVCLKCVRENPDEALSQAREAHKAVRARYGLPPQPPRTPGGIRCALCSNECAMGLGEKGYCGLRENRGGKLESVVSAESGLLHAYLDPHITNCCAAWFCPGGTGLGYPRYARLPGCEKGYFNYAVFFYGCNFNCLFCQNPSHKKLDEGKRVTAAEFKAELKANPLCTCICFFGGSPEPQLPFAVNASKNILEESPNRVLRVCFEWNGCGNEKLVREAAELSFKTGGNIKFDLKCFNPNLSVALSGVPNNTAYRNFEIIAREFYEEKPKPPVLTATTLLVPGYVDALEVESIARFISDLNPNIPYSLLLFHPDYYMSDMPYTSKRQLEACLKAAKKHLKNVHVGNIQLLGM